MPDVLEVLPNDDDARDPRRRRSAIMILRIVCLGLAFLLLGNGTILGLSLWARGATDVQPLELEGVRKGVAVDAQVWRGAAPSGRGYRELAAAGVSTVVDLRSDSERGPAVDVLADLPVRSVRLPIRDGQVPTDAEVSRFLEIVAESDGPVFVHCGAGVGRTGAMVAAYQTALGATGAGAVRRNLAVGPPSLEQIVFAATGGEDPLAGVTLMSRVLDGPRRIWHNLT